MNTLVVGSNRSVKLGVVLALFGILTQPACLLASYPCDPDRPLSQGDSDGDGWMDCLDCAEDDPAINPDAPEICDGVDNNCNGTADEEGLYWIDVDDDGFGDIGDEAPVIQDCREEIEGRARFPGDCNDADASINPGVLEICDREGIDENCDGEITTGLLHVDYDGDGYGDPDSVAEEGLCSAPPAGRVADATDCDDRRDDVNPGAPEVCDGSGVDEDCDGLGDYDDEDISLTALELFIDDDGDGYGIDAVPETCSEFNGAVTEAGDCDDSRDDVSPGAEEVCDGAGVDEDCDGAGDLEDTDFSEATYYVDGDGDGWGAEQAAFPASCAELGGLARRDGDCEDGESEVNPGAEEICQNGVDDDCDGGASGCKWPSLMSSNLGRVVSMNQAPGGYGGVLDWLETGLTENRLPSPADDSEDLVVYTQINGSRGGEFGGTRGVAVLARIDHQKTQHARLISRYSSFEANNY